MHHFYKHSPLRTIIAQWIGQYVESSLRVETCYERMIYHYYSFQSERGMFGVEIYADRNIIELI